ncbi:MAG: ATP-binding cassette domain-containing protein [Defluviitaleaceae bacterium]|nr:ATP-binding cassette domain-containing protein [Defluviitaleaceae bacterium]
MLKLENIKKSYNTGGEAVIALRGVSLEFRTNEFVSILGPSGCGKTTMLNIIGGLDQYDSGDLVISGTSTKHFKDVDWDAYRNRSIGFVFQNYNLIIHQTILQNVELAMTLSGVSGAERTARATKALQDVGLGNRLGHKPNQLSGGQMQRVAIARALVNNPEIILADEPTGALDSKTSIQIMEILQKVAKTRLVIMVTHNPTIAEQYSTRIVSLLDGELQSDSNPLTQEEKAKIPKENFAKKFKHTSMSMFTAMSLSFKNLLTKKGRTVTMAIAGSIGIIGIGLVLALIGGINSYMRSLEEETADSFPLVIGAYVPGEMVTGGSGAGALLAGGTGGTAQFPMLPDGTVIHRFLEEDEDLHYNIMSEEFLDYMANIHNVLPNAVTAVSLGYELNFNVLSNAGGHAVRFSTATYSDLPIHALGMADTHWQQMHDDHDFVLTHFDLLAGRMPKSKNELILVVDQQNRLEDDFFINLGIAQDGRTFDFNDFVGQTMLRVIYNDYYFQYVNDVFSPAMPSMYNNLFDNAGGVDLTIVGVLRSNADPDAPGLGSMFIFSEGLIHTTELTHHILANSATSIIVQSQIDSNINVFTGNPFIDDDEKDEVFENIGANPNPASMSIFTADFVAKGQVIDYINAWNTGRPTYQHIVAMDVAEVMVLSVMGGVFDVLPPLLIGFAAISLVVSTIMIGIITYVSVMERTKEIGILRSVGARKKDISRVFIAETMVIGLASGTLGVTLAFALSIPLETLFRTLSGISGMVSFNPIYGVALIAGSMALTMVAGFFPSRSAAKKDPVEALRTE